MSVIEHRYISLVSSRLDKFKNVRQSLYNFRCPYCGDSQKYKNKCRGYLYQNKSDYNFKCHNCGTSKSFGYFLKDLDPTLYDQYVFERFKSGLTGRGTVVPEPKFEFKKPVFKKKVSIDLPRASSDPRASDYLKKRKINPNDFYYAAEFKKFVNKYKHTYDNVRNDEQRIVIPLMYQEKLIGFQGRALNSFVQPKYLTLMIEEDAPKIYGLDTIDKTSPVYITEGPFDSTFLRNSIAMCGADLDISNWGISNPVYVYDNEPRNREILNRISKTIDQGFSVVIWPKEVTQKDINDMFLAGHNVQDMVESCVYQGLQARLKFNDWKKV